MEKVENDDDGPPIIKEESEIVFMNMKDENPIVIDWIITELLKNLAEEMQKLLYEITTKSSATWYNSRNLSKAELLLFLKKKNIECSN